MRVAVETELFDQRLSALLHRLLDDGEDRGIGDALVDRRESLHPSQIGRNGMSRIERKELALDIGQQVIGQIHPLDMRCTAHERLLLDVPLVEILHDHVDRVLAAHRRHDAVDRTVGEPDVRVAPCGLLGREMLVNLLPELRGGTDAVLAGDDVQRLPDACGAARGDALGDGRGDEGQDAQPDGRGDDLGAHDLVDDLPAARIDTRNITDPHVAALHVHDVHGVGAVLVDAVDDLHVHIGENHMVPRLGEYRTDESAADIARAELNCSFHIVLQKD